MRWGLVGAWCVLCGCGGAAFNAALPDVDGGPDASAAGAHDAAGERSADVGTSVEAAAFDASAGDVDAGKADAGDAGAASDVAPEAAPEAAPPASLGCCSAAGYAPRPCSASSLWYCDTDPPSSCDSFACSLGAECFWLGADGGWAAFPAAVVSCDGG